MFLRSVIAASAYIYIDLGMGVEAQNDLGGTKLLPEK